MHLTDEILEYYELGQLAQPAVNAVEDHLLICEDCRDLQAGVEEFIATLRAGVSNANIGIVFWQLHVTDEGLVEIWVEKFKGRWMSLRRSRRYETAVQFATMADAIREATDNFRRLFPAHHCGSNCMW